MQWKEKISLLASLLEMLEITNGNGDTISQEQGFKQLGTAALRVRESHNTLFFIGNGASASMGSHFAADFAKNGRLHTQTFTDLSLITAVANDLSFAQVFSEPLKFRGKAEDLLVVISSSGASLNLLKAVEVAGNIGMQVVTLTGMKSGNPLRKLGHLNFYIAGKTYGMVESGHAVVLHHWMDMLTE